MVDKAVLAVPSSYRDLFEALGEREILPRELAARLAASSGLRNLLAQGLKASLRARMPVS